MPRQSRLFPPWATLHVISRGNRRQKIFEEEPDWRRFLSSLLEETAAEGIILLAYCLMPNHYHLLLEASAEILSRAMHRLLTSHAVYMNRKYGRTGHLFEDRFKSFPCEPELGLKPLVRYIHRNPVRAGLVSCPGDWEWSSHRDYMDPASDAPSGKREVLKLFGTDPASAIQSYASFMEPDAEFLKARAGGFFPLEKLAAMVERELGHRAGLIKERSKRRDLTGARRLFIKLALDAGHSPKVVALFLCIAEESVQRLRRGESRVG